MHQNAFYFPVGNRTGIASRRRFGARAVGLSSGIKGAQFTKRTLSAASVRFERGRREPLNAFESLAQGDRRSPRCT